MKQATANRRPARLARYRRWMFPAVILLLAGAVALTFSFLSGSNKVRLAEPAYQFYQDRKVEYQAGTSLIYGKYGSEFEQDSERSEGDGTPVYSQTARRLTLPGNMYWLDPSTGREWLVDALSSLRLDESGAVWCGNGKKEVRMEGGFLSDAAGTFLFLDSMTLRWNGRTDSAEPFSFYSFSAEGTVRVYRYEAGELIYEDDLGEKDSGVSDRGYEIDFTSGVYVGADGSRRLLISDPKLLSSIFR